MARTVTITTTTTKTIGQIAYEASTGSALEPWTDLHDIDSSVIRDLLARTADDSKYWPRSMGPQFKTEFVSPRTGFAGGTLISADSVTVNGEAIK